LKLGAAGAHSDVMTPEHLGAVAEHELQPGGHRQKAGRPGLAEGGSDSFHETGLGAKACRPRKRILERRGDPAGEVLRWIRSSCPPGAIGAPEPGLEHGNILRGALGREHDADAQVTTGRRRRFCAAAPTGLQSPDPEKCLAAGCSAKRCSRA